MKRAAPRLIPPIPISHDSGVAKHKQLYEWFRGAIVEGRLRPGQYVPSTRILASETGVSRITVLSAYEQLRAEGYLEAETGSGTMVSKTIPDEIMAPLPISRRGKEARLQAEKKVEQPWLKQLGAFRVSLPALEEFPINDWACLVGRRVRKSSRADLAYGSPAGSLRLRTVIAEYLRTMRGVRCQASQVMVVHGSQQGLDLCARTILKPGSAIWIEEPGYPGAHQAFTRAGVDIVPVPVDGFGLNVKEGERLRMNACAAYTTPSHQYPLGATLSASRRMQLLEWAARHRAWIIEDDYDSEYRFDSRPISAIQGMDQSDRVIYVGTFSKVLFPALRVGYLVLPASLVDVFAEAREATDFFQPTLYESVLGEFIESGRFAKHLRRMRSLYMERRTVLVHALEKALGSNYPVHWRESRHASGVEVAREHERFRGGGDRGRAWNLSGAAIALLPRPRRDAGLDSGIRRRRE